MNIVKQKRKKMKITQKNLARQCKVKQSHISRIENFNKMPSSKIIIIISKKLNLCPVKIFKSYILNYYNFNYLNFCNCKYKKCKYTNESI